MMRDSAQAYLETVRRRYPVLESEMPRIERAAEILMECYRRGGKVLTCGNGGSAADAEHIVGELMKGFRLERPLPAGELAGLQAFVGGEAQDLWPKLQRGLPALCLDGHASLATAIMNDLHPHLVFAQQVMVLGQSGDVLIALSTSGNSPNVVRACQVAGYRELQTIGFCGTKACLLDEICDCVIHAPEAETYKIQELHLPIYHALCLAVEEEQFGESGGSSEW